MATALMFWNLLKDNLLKVIIVFLLGGTVTVLGLVPGTENVSNIIGGQITNVKATLHTTAPTPTVVQ